MNKYNVILASKSPRRKKLLREMGLKFSIRETNVEEGNHKNLNKREHAEYLSALKAAAVKIKVEAEVVIAADTVVYLGEVHLGKPVNEAEAKSMLALLSGKVHEVITAVTLRSLSNILTFSCVTNVHFSVFSEENIDAYINEYEPFDKAGAYGIQELLTPDGEQTGPLKIEKVEGSYSNVMGLPVEELTKQLKEFLTQ